MIKNCNYTVKNMLGECGEVSPVEPASTPQHQAKRNFRTRKGETLLELKKYFSGIFRNKKNVT
jgi:hypothetical protein